MGRKTKPLADQMKDRQMPQDDPNKVYAHSGSTLLNLAMSDRGPKGGILTGKMINIIGDSSAGKTFLGLSLLAEAAHIKAFDGYRFFLDDVEVANEFDMPTLFGSAADRVEPPAYDDEDEPKHSDTIQDWETTMHDLLDEGTPFVYILDSMDALSSEAEQKKSSERIKARKAGKVAKGEMTDGKAKSNSSILRQIIRKIEKTSSLLIIISQTRDAINTSFPMKVRSGGRALKFYATIEMWMAVKEKLKSRDRQIGVRVRCKVSKNKMTGKVREIDFSIYYSYGIDDLGSMVDFLVTEKAWTKRGQKIVAPGFGEPTVRAAMIRRIENSGKIKKVAKLTERTWLAIEDSLKLDRKPKYG